jgi:hypothetical protein
MVPRQSRLKLTCPILVDDDVSQALFDGVAYHGQIS